jgi:hypothetical protein
MELTSGARSNKMWRTKMGKTGLTDANYESMEQGRAMCTKCGWVGEYETQTEHKNRAFFGHDSYLCPICQNLVIDNKDR